MDFKDILNHVQENESDLTVVNIGKNYFTIENKEGYQVYLQVATLGFGYSLSSKVKHNKMYWEYILLENSVTISEFTEAIYKTLEHSKERTLKAE
ncbi:hypothetical protein [Bacillus sp. NPDC094106]|uniref:hypothetical protein n=1 Tax=Bacillus sp. NPDC094106 TaxID=3363949 RepID=UPI0038066AB0